jgi:capsular exopolysaccharide synthesis family protein
MIQAVERTDADAFDAAETGGGTDLFAIAWRGKWLALLMIALALGLGYLFYLQATPVYESRTQILLIKKQADLPVDGAERQVNYEDELSTHMILICSPKIVGRAMSEYNLASLMSLRGEEAPLAKIIEGLSTERGGDRQAPDPNVFELAYEGLDSQDCQTVLRAILNTYQDFLGETYQDFDDKIYGLINEARGKLGKELIEKETAYRDFRQQSPLLFKGKEGENLHELRMAEIETARSQVLVRNSQTQARLDAIGAAIKRGGNREALMMLAANAEDTGGSPATRTGRTEFERQLFMTLLEEQMLLEPYGPDHPKVLATQKKMQLIREHLGTMPLPEGSEDGPIDLLALYVESLRLELEVGKEEVAKLDETFDAQRDRAKEMRTFLIDDETMRREIDRIDSLYSVVVKRLEEMDLIRDYGGVSTEVISDPYLGALVYPKLPIVLAISAVLGLFAGLGLSYLRELADRRFRNPEDVRSQLGLPLIGHIPLIEEGTGRKKRVKKAAVDGRLDPVLCAYHKPKSRQAEAYRALRTALYFSSRGAGHTTIQVTSPNVSDGKTTLASNLAVSIANSGKSVLLVDADFRRPRIHSYFGLDGKTGLSSVVTEEAELVEAIHETPIANLWALPCGPKPPNPSELLMSPQFEQVLEVVKQKYDFVIIDTPPLLAVTDPSVVAPRADGVVLVIRLTKHARHDALRATEMLGSLGAETLGVVVNGIGKRKHRYGSYYRYGGYYRYAGYRYGAYRYGVGYGYGYGKRDGDGDGSYYSDERAEELADPAADGG